MTCRACKKMIAEDIVRENIERDQKDVPCPYCRTPTLISEGVADPRARSGIGSLYLCPENGGRSTHGRGCRESQAGRRPRAGDSGCQLAADPTAPPQRSPFHRRDIVQSETLERLLQDLRRGEFLGIETVEYLVISGDFTDRGSEEGFESRGSSSRC